MNAIRKATEHKRKPPRPRVSEAGRRVLEWLDKYGPLYTAQVCVSSATIRALHARGLIYITVVGGILPYECQQMGLTDLGRSVLQGEK